MRSSFLCLVVLLSACGESDAEIGGGEAMFAAEEEIDTTSDALLSNSAKVWFPMQEGNTWTFASSSGDTREISYSDVESGVAWLEGVGREGQWAGLSSSAPNTLYSWNYDAYRWEPLYRFGYAVTPWTIGAGCDKFTLRRSATDATVVVPAGSFTGARTISYTHRPPANARCMVPVLSSITFAPGVGPVMLMGGDGVKYTLRSARVNGKSYPAAPAAVTSKLTFDQVSYTSYSNTIVCITTPCPGNAVTAEARFTYSITNGTNETKTWQFNSGCQYDLTLTDAMGRVMRSASEGRACTLALTSINLAPGQTKTFTGSIELQTVDGTQLEGAFTGKAFLIPRSGAVATPVAPATASFSVRVTPAIP